MSDLTPEVIATVRKLLDDFWLGDENARRIDGEHFADVLPALLDAAEENAKLRAVVDAAKAAHLPPGERCAVACRLCDALAALGES